MNATSSRRILVVEDDEICRILLEEGLRAAGHEVLTAVDGIEARQRMLEESIDVIVTDMLMPRMDGRAFVQWLRDHEQRESWKRHPVIAATSCIQPEDVAVVASGEFDAWIIKPYAMPELYSALDRISAGNAA